MPSNDVFIVRRGAAVPVHEAWTKEERLRASAVIPSDCFAYEIAVTGTDSVTIDGRPYLPGQIRNFTPPVLNCMMRKPITVVFQGTGSIQEVWITRTYLNFCYSED